MARGRGASYDAQVADLADAAVRVVERDGLPGLTFRMVAAEAGVSPGRVQHYFHTRKALISATFRRVRELTQARVERELSQQDAATTPHDIIFATLRAMIPTTEPQVSLFRVGQIVELHAGADSELSTELREGRTALVDFIAHQLMLAGRAGAGARSEAIRTVATVEGLASLTATGTISAAEALRLLERGECA